MSGVLAFAYLGSANLLLQTRLLRALASKGPDLELEYEGAYSLWPGRARFRGLTLAAQDYNVQFAIRIESGVVDVSLHELLAKRFHALRLRAEGTSFRFRHKVHRVGENAERLAAYPPIGDYPDPPLYQGPKPPPVSDADYDLWEIALDDIDAQLSEVWILEHRYAGRGVARGGFHLRPARWFQVDPATVTLDRGVLTFGPKTLAPSLFVDIGAHIERTDVTQETGLGMLRSITAKLTLDSGDLDSSIARVYLPREFRAAGWLRASAHAGMTAGTVDPGSSLEIEACPLRLSTESAALEGSLKSSFRVTEPGKVAGQILVPELVFGRGELERRPAVAVGSEVRLDLSIGDVTQPFGLQRVEASIPDLTVPSLAQLDSLLARAGSRLDLGGRLEADAHLVWQPLAVLDARAKARVIGGKLEWGDVRVTFGARADAELAPVPGAPGTSRGAVAIDLDDVQLREKDRKSAPFRAAARSRALTLALRPEPRVSATWQVSADPADALLSVLVGAPLLEELAATVLDLERLRASAKLVANKRLTRLELVRGESGAIQGTGYWQRPSRGKASGAFLLTTHVANVGLAIDGSELETDMFVADDWLEKRQAAQPPQGRKRGQ